MVMIENLRFSNRSDSFIKNALRSCKLHPMPNLVLSYAEGIKIAYYDDDEEFVCAELLDPFAEQAGPSVLITPTFMEEIIEDWDKL